jgi:hypothetical protein
MSTVFHDLIADENLMLQACLRWAHADAAPYREQCLPVAALARLAAQHAEVRYPPSALYDRPENVALRECYAMIFRCVATPSGAWPRKDGGQP